MTTIPCTTTIAPPDAAALSDGQLLEHFIRRHDEPAFAELVRRHGVMVLGVCQRVLDNPHDAEDCFQAAFMVLVRKAASIQPREMVGNWLYGVAYRTALEARKLAARRRNMEKRKCDLPRSEPASTQWQELRPLLDSELSRLPDKYRFVLIACDLEGKTRKQVARVLRLPEGTVASRLARARGLLAKRLARHKMVIAPGALAALLSRHADDGAVPASLASATSKAAAQLASGHAQAGVISAQVAALSAAVIRGMLLAKLKMATAALVILAVLGLGVGALIPFAQADKTPTEQAAGSKPKKQKPKQLVDYVLQKVDHANHSIHAMCRSPGGGADRAEAVQLDVVPTTKILIDGAEGNFADLKPGVWVNLEFQRGADGKATALLIEASGIEMPGVLQAIDGDTLTIHDENEIAIVKKTYELVRTAWVVINGKKSKLTDLKFKMKVKLKMSATKPEILGIEAVGPKVDGSVKAVDPKRGALSLDIKDTHLVAEGITVDPDAEVVIDGKQAKLADVKTGMRVTVQMSAEVEPSRIIAITTRKP